MGPVTRQRALSPGRAAEVGAAPSAARQRSYGPGVHCWSELRTSDVERATRFYADVFGWTASEAGISEGQPYATLHLGRVPLAGVSARTDTAAAAGKGGPAFWRLYAAVVGGRAAGDGGRAAGDGGRAAGDGGRAAGDGGRAAGDGGRAAGDGGRAAGAARSSLDGGGRAGREGDRKPARSTGGRPSAPGLPAGAIFAAERASLRYGAGEDVAPPFVLWIDLDGGDPRAAASYCREFFRDGDERADRAPLLLHNGDATAPTSGLTIIAGDLAGDASGLPICSVGFVVKSCGEVVRRAEASGGRVFMRGEPLGALGHVVTLIDPQGATFACWEPAPSSRQ